MVELVVAIDQARVRFPAPAHCFLLFVFGKHVVYLGERFWISVGKWYGTHCGCRLYQHTWLFVSEHGKENPFVRPDGGGPGARQGRSLDDSTTTSYFLDFGALLECP